MAKTPRTYQARAIEILRGHMAAGKEVGSLCMATGGGKTFTAVEFLRQYYAGGGTGKSVILAHFHELYKQWGKELKATIPPEVAHVDEYLGSKSLKGEKNPWAKDIIVVSIPALRHVPKNPPADTTPYPPTDLACLIVDECHHALAKTWMDAMKRFKARYTVGLSATPVRGDGRTILKRFNPILYLVDLQRLIRLPDSNLVDAKGWRRRSKMDITAVPISRKTRDYHRRKLGWAVDTPDRNALAIDAYLERGEGRPAIAFCASREHAKHVAEEAQRRGIDAEALDGATKTRDRAKILKRFKDGNLQMITNCAVLTEGFDEPRAAVALLLRPYTKISARVLLPQSVGRVLRWAEGKPYAIVIEVVDVDTRGAGGGSLEDVFLVDLDEHQGELLADAVARQRLEEERRRVQGKIRAVQQFVSNYSRPIPAEDWEAFVVVKYLEDAGELNWLRQGERGVLNLGSMTRVDASGRTARVKRRAEVAKTVGGLYAVTIYEGGEAEPLTVAETEDEAVALANWLLVARQDPGLGVAKLDVKWRSEPSTEGQHKKLADLTACDAEVFETLRRGPASDLRIEVEPPETAA